MHGRAVEFFRLGNHDFPWEYAAVAGESARAFVYFTGAGTRAWRTAQHADAGRTGKHLFIPSWMRSSPRRRPRSLRGVELRTHARLSETNTKTLSIDELLHALPWCKANNCDYCMCPALDVSKHITSRVTFPGHDTIKWLKIYREKKK